MEKSDRLDEQRCAICPQMAENSDGTQVSAEIPKKTPPRKEPIDEVLLAGKPYPLVVLPVNGEYWQEGTNHMCGFDNRGKHIIKKIDPAYLIIEDDLAYCNYKNFFQKQEHFNFTTDSSLGPLLLSLKYEENCSGCDDNDGDIVRIILRSAERTIQGAISSKDLPPCPGPRDIVKKFVPDLVEDFCELQFHPVIYPKASSLITRFDEHGHAEKFKVGVIYQRAQQRSESQFFANKSHSKAMHDFLQILGEEIELFGFKGYNGGLDTKNQQTGRKSVYTKYKGREIMFHVSTLLPYTSGDAQQLQRKRHIGNDIIAIIFQDENTPFCPSSIRSSFLHIFIVVQVEEAYSKNTRYKITVTAKEDVPEFGPALPNPAVFSKNDPHLRDFLLTKLLNAELAAFKAKQFSTLMERTRKLLFEDLHGTLAKKSQEMLLSGLDGVVSGQSKGKIFNSLRNAFKSEAFERSNSVTPRSKSLENLVQKFDEENEKTTKKKRAQNPIKRHSVSDKPKRPGLRPKSKSLFHAPPLSAVDATDVREHVNSVEPDVLSRDGSPTFNYRDPSPSGTFLTSSLPSDLPKPSPVFVKSLDYSESKEPGSPETPRTWVSEATLQSKRLNGLISSPRNKRRTAGQTDRKTSNAERQSLLQLVEESSLDKKADKNEDEASLVAQLRGELYKLSRENGRLKRENQSLCEDLKGVEDAMIKQAEDLCESQYQLNMMLVNAKQKGHLTASAV